MQPPRVYATGPSVYLLSLALFVTFGMPNRHPRTSGHALGIFLTAGFDYVAQAMRSSKSRLHMVLDVLAITLALGALSSLGRQFSHRTRGRGQRECAQTEAFMGEPHLKTPY